MSSASISTRVRIIFLLIVFLGTAINFYFYSKLLPVFDETEAIVVTQQRVEEKGLNSLSDYFDYYWTDIWFEPKDRVSTRPLQPNFYRPLTVIITSVKLLSCHIFSSHSLIPKFFNSLFWAFSGALIYLLGIYFTRDHWISGFSAFFMMFSLPSLTGTWISLTGSHPAVTFLVGTSLYSYVKFKQTSLLRWTIPVICVAVIGPLYREFTMTATIIVFAAELFLKNRNIKFLILLIPLLIHGIWPAFLINFIFFDHVVFSSTVSKLNIPIRAFLGIFHFNAINHLFFAIPPAISLLAIGGMLVTYNKERNVHPFLMSVCVIVITFAYSTLFFSPTHPLQIMIKLGPFILITIFSVFAFRIHVFLGLWLVFSWVPFLCVFFNQVYLMYVLGPFLLVLLFYVRELLKYFVFQTSKGAKILHGIVFLLIFLGIVDQGANFFTAYHVYTETNNTARAIALNIGKNISNKSDSTILLSSTILGSDVQYYFQNEYKGSLQFVGYTFTEPDKGRKKVVEEKLFTAILNSADNNERNIYLLDIDVFPTLLSTFVNKANRSIQKIFDYQFNIVYYYFDPIRYFIPKEYVPVPCTPDLQSHLLFEGGIFVRQVSAKHTLYKVQ